MENAKRNGTLGYMEFIGAIVSISLSSLIVDIGVPLVFNIIPNTAPNDEPTSIRLCRRRSLKQKGTPETVHHAAHALGWAPHPLIVVY